LEFHDQDMSGHEMHMEAGDDDMEWDYEPSDDEEFDSGAMDVDSGDGSQLETKEVWTEARASW
jgi:hypothetical protein